MDRLTPFGLVRQNLVRKPFRTGMLAGIVALFSFTLFCGTIVASGVSQGTRMMAERLGADALFVPYGYESKAQGTLLRGEPSSFFMNGDFTNKVRQEEGIEKASSQLFIATLNAACCTLPVQIIGIDPATDFVVKPWMASAIDRPLAENEIAVGSKVSGNAGESILLFGKEFTVAARLAPTGMGFDTSVFMEIDRARRLLLLSELGPRLQLPENVDRNSFISSTLVKFAPTASAKDAVNATMQKYAMEYNLDFVAVPGMITDIASQLDTFSVVFYSLSGALWVIAVGILALVFSSAVQERKREFGLLRLIGAARGDLTALVLKEAILISGGGALLGLAVGGLLLFSFNTYIDSVLQLPSLQPGFTDVAATGACVFLLGLAAGPLACLPAVRRLARTEAYASLREDA